LLQVNSLIVGIVGQQNEEAALEMKNNVAQMDGVLAFVATPAGSTD
jgi:hypothetical protein